MQSLSQL